ncbi:HIT-like domain-containing protein [Bombardia bombarda]|uniref:Bis(5'-adenosyl)-triphosphatase n=1 Tax=Bombardia bombarda TaxID=252184 RepID=A0AA39XNF8_9PEZI|nr:HIT-like domain-containing protein [Bombardia bombarda]
MLGAAAWRSRVVSSSTSTSGPSLQRGLVTAAPLFHSTIHNRNNTSGLKQQRVRMSSKSNSAMASTTTQDGQQQQQAAPSKVHFGPFEVTNQVFLTTTHSFALVNLKPLLPGHVLVCPSRPARRLTELTPPELTDLFCAVQRVQRMLARRYFPSPSSPPPSSPTTTQQQSQQPKETKTEETETGSFNIALQDGPEAGQTVSHVHVHVIPRIRGSTAKAAETPSDELYDRMADEDGNVGGAQWDREMARAAAANLLKQQQQKSLSAGSGDSFPLRPQPGGRFPSIEDCDRKARSMEEMEKEAGLYRRILAELEEEDKRGA